MFKRKNNRKSDDSILQQKLFETLHKNKFLRINNKRQLKTLLRRKQFVLGKYQDF